MLNNFKKIIFVLLLIFFFSSCKKENEPLKYSAKVDNTFLFDKDIDSVLTTEKYRNFYKDEYINSWIRNQVMYKEAVKNGILDDPEYKNLVEEMKKEAAVALYLKNKNEEFDLSCNDDDLKIFYKDNMDEFRCSDDAYVINEIFFVSQDKALQFRAKLIENGWDAAVSDFKNDSTIKSMIHKKFFLANELQPDEIYKIVISMQENEVSILSETEPGVFAVVQLVKSFSINTVPDFESVSELVKDRFLMQKRKILMDELIQKIYSKYDIEIKKDK